MVAQVPAGVNHLPSVPKSCLMKQDKVLLSPGPSPSPSPCPKRPPSRMKVPQKKKKEGFGPWADTKITWATTPTHHLPVLGLDIVEHQV